MEYELTKKITLPDFIIGGAPKCASTSLSETLSEHPDIYIPEKKELNFFQDDKFWERGLEWYSSFFKDLEHNESIFGEATPDYLDSEKAMRRIKDIIPEVKLIFILRNPIERAYSHYWYDFFQGIEDRSFKKSIQFKYDVNDLIPKVGHERKDYVTYFGFYGKYLDRYLKNFSKSNIYITTFDELIYNSERILFDIQEFLDVKKINLQLKKSNKTFRRRSTFIYRLFNKKIYWNRYTNFIRRKVIGEENYKIFLRLLDKLNAQNFKKPQMGQKEYKYLVSLYKNDIELLSKITNKNYDMWLNDTI